MLQEEETKVDGGFHLLIESAADRTTAEEKGNFFMMHDLLSEIMPHAREFQNSTVDDIEVRKASMAAIYIFGQVVPT